MAKRSKTEIRRTAWHEAGHVTHALAAGISFHSAWVRHDTEEAMPVDGTPELMGKANESNGAMFTFNHQSEDHPENYITNCMAGFAGERIMRGAKKAGKLTLAAVPNGCGGDVSAATIAVRQRNADPRSRNHWDEDKALNDGLAEAHNILKRHGLVHRMIAEWLQQKGYIGLGNASTIWRLYRNKQTE